ncbi:MAG TPA: hypothetical protein PKO06_18400, partial [Candidatus Ozemobacteraceae bacterium]|nr:hypothetical protein [Candidatus Ozemobacteraceae bacterium]
GQKAQAAGKIEEAVEAFEDAYEAFPGNVQALLLWGDMLCEIGMYGRAFEVLNKIPMASLLPNGQAQVNLLKGKVALASGSLPIAAAFLNDSLKSSPGFGVARVRLALLQLCLGNSRQARQVADDLNSLEGLNYRERAIALLLDLALDNVARALDNAREMSGSMAKIGGEDGEILLLSLWQIPVVLVLSWFPLAGSHALFGLYFLILLCGLAFLASRLCGSSPLWHAGVFVGLAIVHMLVSRVLLQSELYVSILREGCDFSDPFWVMPRVVHAMHGLTLALFVVFPAFLLLPPSARPRQHELYSIWFFSFWFLVTVAVFQARISLASQLLLMAGCALPAIGAAFLMPLGKFLLFVVSSKIGMGEKFEEVATSTSGGGVGFTECKILETKSAPLLEKEQFEEVVSMARKAFAAQPRRSFVALWVAQIKALIELEEMYDAEKSLAEFQRAFPPQPSGEVGQLLNAYLKMNAADHAGALNLLNSVSEQQAKRFTPEQAAWSLLVLGRCYMHLEDPVQAHIELSKALEVGRSPLSKVYALYDLMELELRMDRLEWAQKWAIQAASLKGGPKTTSLSKVIQSMLASAQGNLPEALQLATAACTALGRHGRAWRWLAHLHLLNGAPRDAESILENKLTAGTADALFLMQEIT